MRTVKSRTKPAQTRIFEKLAESISSSTTLDQLCAKVAEILKQAGLAKEAVFYLAGGQRRQIDVR